jgi:hypothetical protein
MGQTVEGQAREKRISSAEPKARARDVNVIVGDALNVTNARRSKRCQSTLLFGQEVTANPGEQEANVSDANCRHDWILTKQKRISIYAYSKKYFEEDDSIN